MVIRGRPILFFPLTEASCVRFCVSSSRCSS